MADFGVLDGVCLLLYANKLDLENQQPLDVNEVSPCPCFACSLRRLHDSAAQIADNLEFNNQQNKILQERLWHIQVIPSIPATISAPH